MQQLAQYANREDEFRKLRMNESISEVSDGALSEDLDDQNNLQEDIDQYEGKIRWKNDGKPRKGYFVCIYTLIMIIVLLGVTIHDVWDTDAYIKKREENQSKHNKIMKKLHKNIHKKDEKQSGDQSKKADQKAADEKKAQDAKKAADAKKEADAKKAAEEKKKQDEKKSQD